MDVGYINVCNGIESAMYSIVESPYFFSTYNVDVRIVLYMYAKIISIDVQYPNKLLHNDA